MFVLFRPVRLLFQAILTQSTPGQMSMGMALGVLLGLVPKGNLIAVVLAVVLAAVRVNLGIAAAAAIACTFASAYLDPVSDIVGGQVLGMPVLQPYFTELYNMPVVPWTNFNNSVVLGSLLIGLVLIWPVHRLSRPVFAQYVSLFSAHARKWKLARLLLGAEWADRFAAVD